MKFLIDEVTFNLTFRPSIMYNNKCKWFSVNVSTAYYLQLVSIYITRKWICWFFASYVTERIYTFIYIIFKSH